jgi:hypothetical protein
MNKTQIYLNVTRTGRAWFLRLTENNLFSVETNPIFIRIKEFFNSHRLYFYFKTCMIDSNNDLYQKTFNLNKDPLQRDEFNKVNHIRFHNTLNK